jgi:hypothetical protein
MGHPEPEEIVTTDPVAVPDRQIKYTVEQDANGAMVSSLAHVDERGMTRIADDLGKKILLLKRREATSLKIRRLA